MKKLLRYFLIIGLVMLAAPELLGQPQAVKPAGDGSSGQPYLISSLANLYWVSQNPAHWNKYYMQTADIDASETQYWDENKGWNPIGSEATPFSGNYNGDKHKITGLYINRPDESNQGLFGYTNEATIVNVYIVNANITAHNRVGGLVGHNNRTTIENCYSSGVLYGVGLDPGDNNFIGGLVGINDTFSAIKSSYSKTNVTGKYSVGGLVGYNLFSTIENSYSTGTVLGNTAVGGLVGFHEGAGYPITNCYSTGRVSGAPPFPTFDLGGLVGYKSSDNIENSYWNIETSQMTESDGGEGKFTSEMIEIGTFDDWDFDNTWSIVDGESYPYLQWQDGPSSHNFPHKSEMVIHANPEEGGSPDGAGFYEFNETVNISANPNDGYFFVNWTGNAGHTDNPDAESTTVSMPNYDIALTANYLPITLTIGIIPEGAGTVFIQPDQESYNEGDVVTLTATPAVAQGYLFDNWSIGETVLTDDKVMSYTMPAAAVTIIANFKEAFAGGEGTEQEPWLIETAEQLNNVRDYVGGDHVDKHFKQIADINLDIEPYNVDEGWLPIGHQYWISFRGNYDGGEHNIEGLYINRPDVEYQGLFGYLGEDAYVKNITLVNIDITGMDHVGGLAGYINKTLVFNCSSGGSVTGNNNTGGLIGTVNAPWEEESKIQQSNSTCNVTGNNNVGGLIGKGQGGSSNTIIIENCYATGNVTGSGANIGGLAGIFDLLHENSGITQSYSSGNVSGEGSNIGGLVGRNPNLINKSFSSGDVYGQNWSTGGLVGRNSGSVNDSYSTGNVNGTFTTGGFVGRMHAGNVTNSYSIGSVESVEENYVGGFSGYFASDANIDKSYWNTETSGILTSVGGEGKTTMEMMFMDTFNEWDFDEIWEIDEDETYPYLKWQTEPGEHNYPVLYTLTIIVHEEGAGTVTGDGLRPAGGQIELSAHINEGAVFINWTDEDNNVITDEETFVFQMPDYDLTIYANFEKRFAGGFGTEEQPWLIETADHLNKIRMYTYHPDDVEEVYYADRIYFKQIADIDLGTAPWNEGEGWEPIGFEDYRFVRATYIGDGFAIENLYINRPESDNVGLFGFVNGHDISNWGGAMFTANVEGVNIINADVTGKDNTGILAGLSEGVIYNSSSSGSVNGANNVGGLVGLFGYRGNIEKSHSSADCNSTGQNAGGLVGYMFRDNIIRYSYSTGNIIGTRYVGGLIGRARYNGASSEIHDSYSSGNVAGNSYAGGLIGMSDEEIVRNCYSTGRVLGDIENSGGLIGSRPGYPERIENSFWDIINSGMESSAGGEGRTTSEMISEITFTGWDFTDTWNIEEGESCPWLAWQQEPDIHNYPPDLFTLTLVSSPDEGGTVEGGGEFPERSVALASASPVSEFIFDGWQDEAGNLLTDKAVFTFTMPSSDVTLTALFSPRTLKIDVLPEDGGTASIDPEKDAYEYFEQVTLTATPSDGYKFVEWIDEDGVVFGSYPVIYYRMPEQSTTITARFDLESLVSEVNPESIMIYPNPARNYIAIESEKSIERISLLDLYGKVIKTVQGDFYQTRIDLSDLPVGTYLLKLETSKGFVSRVIQVVKH